MKKCLAPLGFILSLHLLGLVLLTLIRCALYYQGTTHITAEYATFPIVGEAFLRGVWFDNVVVCYVTLLPLVFYLFLIPFASMRQRFFGVIRIYYGFCYLLLILVGTSDLPYFDYFFRHLNASVFDWLVEDTATTFAMIAGESDYYPAILLFVVLMVFYDLLSRYLMRIWLSVSVSIPVSTIWQRVFAVFLGVVLTGATLFGIRGRMGYNPIRISAAFYCNNPFLNQLGINPAFNLLRSVIDSSKSENQSHSLMEETQAEELVRAYFPKASFCDSISPVARRMQPVTPSKRKENVVLILMESLSADYMMRYGNKQSLTPFLDSLANESLCFDRFFSAANHTNQGILATLYSFPSLLKRNVMKDAMTRRFSGLPTALAADGYETYFFMTHEAQYDNMNAFLRTNGFAHVYAQENYAQEAVVNSFGVPDDYLFRYAVPVLRSAGQEEKPFFATLLTISNHPPYVIPKWFKPTTNTPETQIVEYADYALRLFFEAARKEPWFEQTLFVLVSDHGRLVGEAACEMPLSYNHIPLLLYAPGRIAPEANSQWGMQVDIAPTVLSWLGVPYMQTGIGYDLFSEDRPGVYFCSDNGIAALNDSLYWIGLPAEGQELLYRHTLLDSLQRVPLNQTVTHWMKAYAYSMLQTAETLVHKELCVEGQRATDVVIN